MDIKKQLKENTNEISTEVKAEIRKFNFFKNIKEMKNTIFSGLILFLMLIVFLGFALPMFMQSESRGNEIGEKLGTAVGMATGSFKSAVNADEAVAEGKEEGLSAKDTNASIANRISKVGKLEVLTAETSLLTCHKEGEGGLFGNEYIVWYECPAKAYFTVDLNDIKVIDVENNVTIRVPKPEADINTDLSKITKIDEYIEDGIIDGTSEDGIKAKENSEKEIKAKTKEEIENYDLLMELAEESAKKQIKIICQGVCGTDKNIQIYFTNEEEGNHGNN